MGKWSKGQTITDLIVDRYVNLRLFYSKQQPDPEGSDCVIWTGVKNNVGYGFIGFKAADVVTGEPVAGFKGMMTAHRLAWMIHNGRVPSLRNINHTCHRKDCVNPAHLVEGTQEQKLQDMIRDGIKGGRPAGPAGGYDHKQLNRNYKYTEDEIQWIRNASAKDIAAKYNMSRQRANTMRYEFRKHYRWLPWTPKHPPSTRGRKPKAKDTQ